MLVDSILLKPIHPLKQEIEPCPVIIKPIKSGMAL